MTTMVEKVAKAIHESLGYETPWETCTQCQDAARAAIEAMMEPTSWMLNEAVQVADDQGGNVSGYEYWQRMIQAALKEG